MKIDAAVMFSGGLGSFLAAHLYCQQHPNEKVVLYFNDTKTEDPDLYRFLRECAEWLDLPLIEDSDGRDIWEVFADRSYAGNNRVAPCTVELKQLRANRFAKKHSGATIVLGFDWTEIHRLEGAKKARAKKGVHNLIVAPLCDDFRPKMEIYGSMKNPPKLPSLYGLGFPHNNCGGGCVKAGLDQWALLLKTMPERYRWHEDRQEELFTKNPDAKPFLRKTIAGIETYISLKEFRTKYNKVSEEQQELDFGGCGCW